MDDPGLLLDLYDHLTFESFDDETSTERREVVDTLALRVRAELLRLLDKAEHQ